MYIVCLYSNVSDEPFLEFLKIFQYKNNAIKYAVQKGIKIFGTRYLTTNIDDNKVCIGSTIIDISFRNGNDKNVVSVIEIGVKNKKSMNYFMSR